MLGLEEEEEDEEDEEEEEEDDTSVDGAEDSDVKPSAEEEGVQVLNSE